MESLPPPVKAQNDSERSTYFPFIPATFVQNVAIIFIDYFLEKYAEKTVGSEFEIMIFHILI